MTAAAAAYCRARSSCCSRGFSLLELVIVVLVLSVLMLFAVPSYQSYQQRAQRGPERHMKKGQDKAGGIVFGKPHGDGGGQYGGHEVAV